MPAPFSENHHNDLQIKKIAEEIINTLKEHVAQWDGNGLLTTMLHLDVVGHGVRPFGDYAKGAYRDFSIVVCTHKWDGLTKKDLMGISQLIKSVDGFEVENKDHYIGYGQFTPDFSYPTIFRKYGNACDEWNELKALVSKKYGINLGVKDLYFTHMSSAVRNLEIGERTYVAYAPYRCKQLIEKIKSFGRKHTTCEIVTIDDFEFVENMRAVTLDIKPKVKK